MSKKPASKTDKPRFLTERDAALAQLGYQSYAEYLASDLWDRIRATLNDDPDTTQCVCCTSRTGLVWHHRSYDIRVLIGNFSNNPKLIVRLCTECHHAVHCNGDEWFDLDVVDRRIRELESRYRYDAENANRDGLTDGRHSEFDDFAEFSSPGGF